MVTLRLLTSLCMASLITVIVLAFLLLVSMVILAVSDGSCLGLIVYHCLLAFLLLVSIIIFAVTAQVFLGGWSDSACYHVASLLVWLLVVFYEETLDLIELFAAFYVVNLD